MLFPLKEIKEKKLKIKCFTFIFALFLLLVSSVEIIGTSAATFVDGQEKQTEKEDDGIEFNKERSKLTEIEKTESREADNNKTEVCINKESKIEEINKGILEESARLKDISVDLDEKKIESQNEKIMVISKNDEDSISATNSNAVKDSVTKVTVPIHSYEVVDVVTPVKYEVALNPYELAIKTGTDTVSRRQVVSRNYGILNRSSTDQIVTVTIIVDDLNSNKITFVDSVDSVKDADSDTYAIYLTMVPSDDNEIQIVSGSVDKDVSAESLSDVMMNGNEEHAVALHEGENRIMFKLSKAIYNFKSSEEFTLGNFIEDDEKELLELIELAPDGKGITAFTFDGVLNKKAEWSELSDGIRISIIYTCETAEGDEIIIEGTGAMVDAN